MIFFFFFEIYNFTNLYFWGVAQWEKQELHGATLRTVRGVALELFAPIGSHVNGNEKKKTLQNSYF